MKNLLRILSIRRGSRHGAIPRADADIAGSDMTAHPASRHWFCLTSFLVLIFVPCAFAHEAKVADGAFKFEATPGATAPAGWDASATGVALDGRIVHGGKWSVRIERRAGNAQQIIGISKVLPMNFAGKTIQLKAFLRTENVTDFVGLWMREDDEYGFIEFDNMQSRHLNGTNDWQEYSVTLPVNAAGKQLNFGAFVTGTGTAWIDGMQLLVDGTPIFDAPKAEPTVIDTDHEFDAGSLIKPAMLTGTQIDNLATLAKVWGFLKYHHPLITSGVRHWDYDLFRIMPAILAAPDHAAANRVLHNWVAGLGDVPACRPCAELSQDELYLRPEIAWIDDGNRLGADLSADLKKVYRNRSLAEKQFYVGMAPDVLNPVFEHEPAYAAIRFPDSGFQLLALFRLWNIVEYWSPYRDRTGENWDDVLHQSISGIALAKDEAGFQLALFALIAHIHDSHSTLWPSPKRLPVQPPVGECRLPVALRFIGNDAVVAGLSTVDAGAAGGLALGDIIEAIDGVPVSQLIEQWRPYYPASNEAAQLRDMVPNMTNGACGEVRLRVRRVAQQLDLAAMRILPNDAPSNYRHDRPGDAFQRLSDDVAYIKLSSTQSADVPRYIESALGTKGLIIDIRNYPSDCVWFALGQHFVESRTDFVRFTHGDLANPGAFHWSKSLALQPQAPYYSGKVVILVDELSQSRSEYTTMAFRAAPKAVVIGSTTAGADGDASWIPLPGGLKSMISGNGVFYPDQHPTQRIGIVPDMDVKPTVDGIRAGRDELLEAAIAEINRK